MLLTVFLSSKLIFLSSVSRTHDRISSFRSHSIFAQNTCTASHPPTLRHPSSRSTPSDMSSPTSYNTAQSAPNPDLNQESDTERRHRYSRRRISRQHYQRQHYRAFMNQTNPLRNRARFRNPRRTRSLSPSPSPSSSSLGQGQTAVEADIARRLSETPLRYIPTSDDPWRSRRAIENENRNRNPVSTTTANPRTGAGNIYRPWLDRTVYEERRQGGNEFAGESAWVSSSPEAQQQILVDNGTEECVGCQFGERGGGIRGLGQRMGPLGLRLTGVRSSDDEGVRRSGEGGRRFQYMDGGSDDDYDDDSDWDSWDEEEEPRVPLASILDDDNGHGDEQEDEDEEWEYRDGNEDEDGDEEPFDTSSSGGSIPIPSTGRNGSPNADANVNNTDSLSQDNQQHNDRRHDNRQGQGQSGEDRAEYHDEDEGDEGQNDGPDKAPAQRPRQSWFAFQRQYRQEHPSNSTERDQDQLREHEYLVAEDELPQAVIWEDIMMNRRRLSFPGVSTTAPFPGPHADKTRNAERRGLSPPFNRANRYNDGFSDEEYFMTPSLAHSDTSDFESVFQDCSQTPSYHIYTPPPSPLSFVQTATGSETEAGSVGGQGRSRRRKGQLRLQGPSPPEYQTQSGEESDDEQDDSDATYSYCSSSSLDRSPTSDSGSDSAFELLSSIRAAKSAGDDAGRSSSTESSRTVCAWDEDQDRGQDQSTQLSSRAASAPASDAAQTPDEKSRGEQQEEQQGQQGQGQGQDEDDEEAPFSQRCIFMLPLPCTTTQSTREPYPIRKEFRKVISHVFGRNKRETKLIPTPLWSWHCRQHYQRAKYRSPPGEWEKTQCMLSLDLLQEMKRWGRVKGFTVQLRRREIKRLEQARLAGEAAQQHGGSEYHEGDEGDDEEDQDEIVPVTQPHETMANARTNTRTRTRNTRTNRQRQGGRQTQRRPSVPSPVPVWLIEWIQEREGQRISFVEVKILLEKIEEYTTHRPGQPQPRFPDIEILPVFQEGFLNGDQTAFDDDDEVDTDGEGGGSEGEEDVDAGSDTGNEVSAHSSLSAGTASESGSDSAIEDIPFDDGPQVAAGRRGRRGAFSTPGSSTFSCENPAKRRRLS
ncbi:hypothetical protein BDV18DRAFT_90098 [Aspergillus unguis]